MSHWGNSKELTRVSYGLVKDTPGMNRWTVRAAVHAAIVGALGALVSAGLVVAGAATLDSSNGTRDVVGLVLVVAGLLAFFVTGVLALTAANVQFAGLISATDDVLHGRPLDEDAARAAARGRLGALTGWSAISIAVGMLVSFIRGDGNGGMVTTILRALLAGLVASVWAVVTALALPVIVLERVGAVDGVKRSAGIVRHTWGEAVLGSVRIGARFGLVFILPGLLLVAGGVALVVLVGDALVPVGVLAAVVGVVLMVIGSVKAATCRNVFGVALYRWATGDGALGPFSEEDLRSAVGVRGSEVGAGLTG
jgi:hypothetical protein